MRLLVMKKTLEPCSCMATGPGPVSIIEFELAGLSIAFERLCVIVPNKGFEFTYQSIASARLCVHFFGK